MTVIDASSRFARPAAKPLASDLKALLVNGDIPVTYRKCRSGADVFPLSGCAFVAEILRSAIAKHPAARATTSMWYDDKGCDSVVIHIDPELLHRNGWSEPPPDAQLVADGACIFVTFYGSASKRGEFSW